MKTTVDLPDNLLIEAKKRAAEQRRPLRALIADGIRGELARTGSPRARRKSIDWNKLTVPGGLPPVDVSDRRKMWDWIAKER
jgi:hypothetical protein